MVKIERSTPAPESLAVEKTKADGKYDKPDVVERLKKDFNDLRVKRYSSKDTV